MAQQNKTKLKTYYQTGDIPTADEYGELIDSQLNLAETAIQIGECSISSSGNIRLLGSSSFIGDITASGEISASAASTITGGTGSFSNLFGMNQAVLTTSNVTFARINITKTSESDDAWGASVTTEGQAFTITLTSVPDLLAQSNDGPPNAVTRTTTPSTVTNADITSDQVVIGTSTSGLSVHPFAMANGSFKFNIANETGADFTAGTAVFNFVIL